MYPNTLDDYKALEKTTRNLRFHDIAEKLLFGPLFPTVVMLMLAAFIMSSGCASRQMFVKNKADMPMVQCNLPQLVVVATDVPIYNLGAINRAIKYWNKVIGKEVFIFGGSIDILSKNIRKSPFIAITVIPEKDALEPQDRAVTRYWMNKKGTCVIGNEIEYIPTRMHSPVYFETVILHEMGHTLSLDHSPFKGDLMYRSIHESINNVLEPTREEVCAIRNLYNINTKECNE
jgi:hypothetical protein